MNDAQGEAYPSPPSLASLVPVSARVQPSSLPTPSGRAPVLVADDDRMTRVHLADRLTEWGYGPTTVATGPEALAMLMRRDAPSLAILDWEMPGLTGIQICRALRGSPCQRYTYILIATGGDRAQQAASALNAGADDFVRKPFEEPELRARLRAGARIIDLHTRCLDARAELERRALQDALTGVANRFALNQALEREMARSARTGSPLSVVLFDIDHFKRVNDTFGHLVGDDVIRGVATRSSSQIRRYDTLGRYGGEEFLLIAPECGAEQAASLAERMRRAICGRLFVSGISSIAVTASFGVASTDQRYRDVRALLEAADEALYMAKRAGRNGTQLAPGAHRKLPKRRRGGKT
jgi:two-component system, cell cycle response regulator